MRILFLCIYVIYIIHVFRTIRVVRNHSNQELRSFQLLIMRYNPLLLLQQRLLLLLSADKVFVPIKTHIFFETFLFIYVLSHVVSPFP